MQHKQIFPSNTTTCGQINLFFNQSLHDGQQNTAINMKYDTLQTQMDTGKNATKGNLWVEIPLKKKK